jgi:hypothetical protein
VKHQPLPHHVFNLRPEMWVALTFHVAGGNDAVEPGGLGALDWILAVIHAVISQDVSSGGIGGNDLGATVDEAVWLIEIYGLSDVIWNDRIVLPQLGYAIHLNREQDRNPFPSQIAGERHGRCRSPALAEQDYARPSLFFSGKNAVTVRVQQADNSVIGSFAAPVFKDPDESSLGYSLPDSLRELNRTVVRIIMTDEAAYEPDHNIRRRCSRFRVERTAIESSRERRHGGGESTQKDDEGTKCSESGHAHS